MKTWEQAKQSAVSLHWLATLLTGSGEIAADVTAEAIAASDDPDAVFSAWMRAWSRRLVIARALTTVREDLAASARRMALRRTEKFALPPRSWVLDPGTTKSDLERALLSIDVFPRAAALLLVFERVPLRDAAILLDAEPDLVRKAQAAGVRELTNNLARMQGWKPAAANSNQLTNEWDHV
jgi:DNA-directed RNA polymerase specialized sigma24 family protein